MRQWMLRITAYAERLLEDLEGVDWPESIKEMQRNWIGRSEGAEIDFAVAGHDASFHVFTTRPDTLFGATYMVLAPEHPLVDASPRPQQRAAVEAYSQRARSHRAARARRREAKTGVFTGAFACNPVNGERLPIWIADYVLMGYGTGAIMAVPAHDERDRAFADTLRPADREVVAGGALRREGGRVHRRRARWSTRSFLDGLDARPRKARMIEWLEEHGKGRRACTTSCATGSSRASATGASRSRSALLEDGTMVAGAGATSCRSSCRRSTTTSRPTRRAAAGARRREWLMATMPRRARRRARDQHDAAVGGLVLVLPALPRPAERARAVVAGGRAVLDARRPVRRRRGARRAAPALRALLAQGAVRRGLVPTRSRFSGCSTRDDPGQLLPGRAREVLSIRTTSRSATARGSSRRRARRLDMPGREDVEVGLNVVSPDEVDGRSTAPMRCGSTRCSWARSTR